MQPKSAAEPHTTEQVFSSWEGIAVALAGLNHDADTPLTPEWPQWADLIFVKELAVPRKDRNKKCHDPADHRSGALA